jgi:uncharacterized membrane protein YhdT
MEYDKAESSRKFVEVILRVSALIGLGTLLLFAGARPVVEHFPVWWSFAGIPLSLLGLLLCVLAWRYLFDEVLDIDRKSLDGHEREFGNLTLAVFKLIVGLLLVSAFFVVSYTLWYAYPISPSP